MRIVSILLLLLALAASPAYAAIQFLGHGTNASGCVARLDWSSDLGAPYVATRPFAALVNGYDCFSDTSRSLFGILVNVEAGVWVAPAGPASFTSGPVLSFHGNASVLNNGNLYGRTASASHSACLQYVAPGASATTYWAVRWRRAVALVGGGSQNTMILSPFGTILNTGAGADSGLVFGTHVGTAASLCNFFIQQEWFAYSGVAGGATGSFDVDLFLDNAPATLDIADPVRPAVALELGAIRPNPASGPATLEFRLPRRGEVVVRIVDLAGRVVRELRAGMLPAGSHVLTWDGRDARGGELSAGVYFASLQHDGDEGATETRGRRIVITR